ncbi:hypothetical protein [Methanosarcina sp. MTP4]|uniref:hypothetical protein n=1 Tax=Methanosarcina sp. MTP4 TaxID=1434100 RepID=UPI0012E06480|nr:hypothetical protein [Methanosarcina sp. MTP4]
MRLMKEFGALTIKYCESENYESRNFLKIKSIPLIKLPPTVLQEVVSWKERKRKNWIVKKRTGKENLEKNGKEKGTVGGNS